MNAIEDNLEIKGDYKITIEMIDFKIPKDLMDFLSEKGGAIGAIGEHYVNMYSNAEILMYNKDYAVTEFLPKHLLIGTIDDEALVIDENSIYYMVPFIGMFKKNCVKIAENLNDLWQYLS